MEGPSKLVAIAVPFAYEFPPSPVTAKPFPAALATPMIVLALPRPLA